MKRIAYICSDPGVPVYGTKGCSVHVQEGMRALRAQGAQITLFAQRIGGDAPADLADIKCIRLPKLSKVTVAAREQSALAANQILQRLLEKEGPFDAVYERYSLWGYAGMEYARDKDLPGILEVNAPLIEEQLQHRMLVHEEEACRVVNRVTSAATALIAVSAAVGEYLGGFPESAGKIHVIPNGVDPNRFSPEVFPSMPSAEDAFTVGFVGTLKPWHGVLDLVEAFAMLHKQAPNSRLLIVGDGPEREMIDARLAAHGLTLATQFTGAVHPADVPGLIASMDVGVAPYPIMENCYFSPLKAFEYMASGIAFVGSNIGQLGELVAHGETGLLYAPGNTGELGKCLLTLYKDRRLVGQLGRTARKAILQSHTWDAVGGRIMQMARQ
ncbi:MAG: glycosyltransferase family 4 protein, partial [Rhodothermales bacterium]